MGGLVESISNTFLGGAEAEAGLKQRRGEQRAQAVQEEQLGEVVSQFGTTEAQFDPFRTAGVSALERQQALLGLSGAGEQQQAFSQFVDSPGQQFIRQREEQSLLRNQAAIGGLGGGNVRTALQQQAAGFAQQDLSNQLAALSQLSGRGQQAVTGLAGLRGQAVGQQQIARDAITGNIRGAAQAEASGMLGQAAQQRAFEEQAQGRVDDAYNSIAGLFGG